MLKVLIFILILCLPVFVSSATHDTATPMAQVEASELADMSVEVDQVSVAERCLVVTGESTLQSSTEQSHSANGLLPFEVGWQSRTS